uniref:Clr5 domain-containing protein n=1 Tax=Bionectria ochroleuca TaxID=29856 RepID=A0A8H7N0Z8_BIOOC
MPTDLQKISKERWEEYRPIIKRLHMDQGLPVKSKIGRPNLTQVMKDDHNFDATHSQYEAQLKKWGWVKNLSKEEWNLVLPLYDWLKEQQMDVRVKVSGRHLEKARLERGRRYIRTRSDSSLVPPPTGWLSMSDRRHITIETREANREWSQYSPLDDTGDMPGHGLNPDLDLISDELMLQDMPPQENVGQIDNGTLVPATDDGLETTGEFPAHMVDSGFSASERLFDNISVPQFGYSQPISLPSSNYQLLCILWELPPSFQLLQQMPAMTLVENMIRTGARPVQQIAQSFSARLLGYSAVVQRRNETPARMDLMLKPSSIELVSQRLVELVQEVESQSDLFGITFGANSLPCAILYSIANGFTGLSEIPASSVVKLLKNEPHVYATMHKLLLDAPALIAKPFAENLLKASVEAADAEAVRVIARTMMKRGIKIDPNKLMCERDGRFLTPAELAGNFRSFDLLQVLLKLGADPDKTFENGPDEVSGALEWALNVRHMRGVILDDEIKPSFALVQMLVEAGAEVDVDCLLRAAKWCRDSRILALMLKKITDDQKGKLLRDLPELIREMDNDLGMQATQTLLQFWKGDSRQCGGRTCQDPRGLNLKRCLQESLNQAVVRQNLELCQLILSRTVPGPNALVRAIGKGNRRIASLLIQHGACTSDYVDERRRIALPDGTYRQQPSLTPLGEAIRLQDPSMLHFVEEQGAWAFVSDRKFFESVAEAAAEVGNMAALERLFAMDVVRDLDPSPDFEHALEAATRKEHIQIVQLLLDKGARPNGRMLELVLRAKNGELIRLLLDTGIGFPCLGDDDYAINPIRQDYSCALELAIEWGNMEIIEELIQAKAHYSIPQQGARGLCAAVRSGNFVLVDLLLSAGVSPDAAYQYEDRKSDVLHRISPLFTAVESGNEEMALHLLQKGADPADATALVIPAGRSDFEATLLIKAIEKETCPYFEQLLEAKMNVNHLSRRNGRTPLGSVVECHGSIYLEIAARLLESGADPNAIARVQAVRRQSYDMDALLLLKTALLLAIEAGNEEMVELLLKNGAEVNKEARRALENAAENGRLDVIKVLWDATGGCGFPATEVARAQRFARARGFPGCAEYVAKLAEASAEASFLQF